MTFSRTFWELCSAKCTRLDGCLAEKPSSKTFSAFIFSWLASSVRSLCSLGRPPPPPQLPHKTPRQLSSISGYGVKVKSGLDNLPFLTFSVSIFTYHLIWPQPKGHLFTKCPFGGVFNSSKMNEKIQLTVIWYLKSNCFCSFFGRIEDTKRIFWN